MASQGYGVIGTGDDGPEEIEHAPAVSITLASLPGVHVAVRHITAASLPDGGALPASYGVAAMCMPERALSTCCLLLLLRLLL